SHGRMAGVEDVEDEVGFGDLLKSGAEGGDELWRELLDESDGVGEQDTPPIGHDRGAGGWIKGGKDLVGLEDPGTGDGVHQRALAGIGVADHRHHRHLGSPARLAVKAPRLSQLGDVAAQLADTPADAPPGDLQLLLARPAGADSTTEAGKLATTGEPGEEGAQLSCLDLQP